MKNRYEMNVPKTKPHNIQQKKYINAVGKGIVHLPWMLSYGLQLRVWQSYTLQQSHP